MPITWDDLITGFLGEDSGWRITNLDQTFSFLAYSSNTLRMRNPHGVAVAYRLRQLSVGSSDFGSRGSTAAQDWFRARLGQVLTGPLGRSGVGEDDIRGAYRSLALGMSTESSENVTLIWFGDFATGASLILSAAYQASIAAQLGLATAVAIVPSGDSNVGFGIGHAA